MHTSCHDNAGLFADCAKTKKVMATLDQYGLRKVRSRPAAGKAKISKKDAKASQETLDEVGK
jgi:hypothetical protein